MVGPAVKKKPVPPPALLDAKDEKKARVLSKTGIREADIEYPVLSQLVMDAISATPRNQKTGDAPSWNCDQPVDLGWQPPASTDRDQTRKYRLTLQQDDPGQLIRLGPVGLPTLNLDRGWEASETTENNKRLFLKEAAEFGIPLCAAIFKDAANGRILNEAQIESMGSHLATGLGQWLNDQLPTGTQYDPATMNLKALLKESKRQVEKMLDDPTLDAHRKNDLLTLIENDNESQTLIPVTDGAWGSLGPENAYPQQGNERLGRDLGINGAAVWGLNYANFDFDPLQMSDENLKAHLTGWKEQVDMLANHRLLLAEQSKLMFQTLKLTADPKTILPADAQPMVDEVQFKLQTFINRLKAHDTDVRKDILLYKVQIAQAHKVDADKLAESLKTGSATLPPLDADALANTALGPAGRRMLIASDQPAPSPITYELEQDKFEVRTNEFHTRLMDVQHTLLIKNGPKPEDALRAEPFKDWMMKFYADHLPGVDVQWKGYNPKLGGYEIALTDKNLPAEPASFDGRPIFAVPVPNEVFNTAAGTSSFKPLVGQSEPSFSPLQAQPLSQIIPFENTYSITQKEESVQLVRFAQGIVGSTRASYGGPTFNPMGWTFENQNNIIAVTVPAVRDLGYSLGSDSAWKEPLATIRIDQIFPSGSLARDYIAKDAVWNTPNYSLNDINLAAWDGRNDILRHFIDQAKIDNPDPGRDAYLANFDLQSLRQYSLPAYMAISEWARAQYLYKAKELDPAHADQYMEQAAHANMAGAKAFLFDFFPSTTMYNFFSKAYERFGEKSFEAMHEQAQFQLLDKDALGNTVTEYYLQYSPGWAASFKSNAKTEEGRTIYGQAEAPLYIPLLGALGSSYQNNLAGAARKTFIKPLAPGVTATMYLGAGGLINMGGATHSLGNYQQGHFNFSTIDTNFPWLSNLMLDVRGVVRGEGHTDHSTFFGEFTFQPSPMDYYQLIQGGYDVVRATRNLFGANKPKFDDWMVQNGIIYSDLYSPSGPINATPLTAAQMGARNILTPTQTASLPAMNDGQGINATDPASGEPVYLKKENGQYNLYHMVDLSNPAFADPLPLTTFRWGLTTSLPLWTMMALTGAIGQTYSVNSLYLLNSSASLAIGPSDPSNKAIPAFKLGYQNDYLRPGRPTPTFTASAKWAPFAAFHTQEADDWQNRLEMEGFFERTTFLSGADATRFGLKFSFEIYVPHTETSTTTYKQTGQTVLLMNPDGSVGYERQLGPTTKTTTPNK